MPPRGTQFAPRASAGATGQFRKPAWTDDARTLWTALNGLNHLVYALLFVVRSVLLPDPGGGERPFFFESRLIGWLVPPGAAGLLGWQKPYKPDALLSFIATINGDEALGSAVYGSLIGSYVADPNFMFWYQVAEGTFHLMICAGALRLAWPGREGGAAAAKPSLVPAFLATLYRAGLALEIVLMDLTYTFAFSWMWATNGVPGYPGLMTFVVGLHHLTVLPDFVSAALELRAAAKAGTGGRKED
jgi:hypothetical protein